MAIIAYTTGGAAYCAACFRNTDHDPLDASPIDSDNHEFIAQANTCVNCRQVIAAPLHMTAEQAATIFEQMGGINRLEVMVGASHYGYSKQDNMAYFRFKLCKKANAVYIKLSDNDTYTMEFARVGLRIGIKTVEMFERVYAEDLVPTFQEFTGLELMMPRITYGNKECNS